jgi:hypothetical protein
MLRALALVILSSCIFAQTSGPRVPVASGREGAGADSVEVRLARVEVAISQMQKQLDDNTSQIRALNTQFTDFRVQLADLSTKVNLIIWIGGILGALSIASMWKMIFDQKGASPLRPRDVERIVRRVLDEDRAAHPAK